MLVRIEALRLADRTPICAGNTWLAAERFPEAGRIYERVRSMTKLLAHYGVRDYRRPRPASPPQSSMPTDASRLILRSDVPFWWLTVPTSMPTANRC